MLSRIKLSRMETSLNDKISRATSQLDADCISAELAAYQARMGRFDKSRDLIALLRQRNEINPRVELSVWLHFSQGILSYFSSDGVTNADGVQRAYALSVAAGLHEMRALCAAWLAQWDYTKVDIPGLVSHVQEALQVAGPKNHACRSRAALVVAQVLHLAGRLDLAQNWYRLSKDHATAGLDGATMGALMHNMAWQRMLLFRQAVLTNKSDVSAGRHALMNAESAAHFEQMIGDVTWPNLKPILRAQILSLSGDARAALAIYRENLLRETVPERWQANLLADKAWCHAALGQHDDATNCAQTAIENLAQDTQIDDMAATHSRLSQTYIFLGNDELAERHRQLAHALWTHLEKLLSEATRLLSQLNENGSFDSSKIQF